MIDLIDWCGQREKQRKNFEGGVKAKSKEGSAAVIWEESSDGHKQKNKNRKLAK